MPMMGKLFCLSVFNRKNKDSKSGICADMPQNTQRRTVTSAKKFSEETPKDARESKVAVYDGVASQASLDSPVFSDLSQLQTPQAREPELWKADLGNIQSNAMSKTDQQISIDEDFLKMSERNEDPSLLLHENLGCDSSDECADESASEVSGPDSSRHVPEDCIFPLKDGANDNSGFYAANKEVVLEEHELHTENTTDVGCSPDNARLSMTCDDELLTGHVSDPGVYERDEREHSPIHSSLVEGSISSQNHESHSCASKSIESASVECYSGQTDINIATDNFSDPFKQEAQLETSDVQICSLEQKFEGSPGYGAINGVKQDLSISEVIPVKSLHDQSALGDVCSEIEEIIGVTMVGLEFASSTTDLPSTDNTRTRVEQWINTIEHLSSPVYEEVEGTSNGDPEQSGEVVASIPPVAPSTDGEFSNAAIRTLNVFSTVAHMGGIGLREVPPLVVFNCLKTLNLSANSITHVPSGCLPQSLHSLDLSRNRISQIEGFRDLTRLRVLNLSFNKISRIGHGLANCTLIKELYLVGNKIAEVEGLHRLLKLSVLDLSHNKVATSKALGQLASNYSSLLALNLLGNPILMNIGEDQVRKLVTSLAPHVTYLNKQPIKAVSVREAVIDSVARAALGTPQRGNKFGSGRTSKGAQPSVFLSKKTSHRGKDYERKVGSTSDHSKSVKGSRHHHHRHRVSDSGSGSGHNNDRAQVTSRHTSKAPMRDHLLRNLALDSGSQAMHRSRSESALKDD